MKWLAWPAAVALIAAGLAWVGGPPLLKSEGEARLTRALGRPVTLGHVAFQPFALKLSVDDVVIGSPGGNAPLLAIDRVVANMSSSSLFRLAPVIEGLEVVRPRLRVAHVSPGHYDVDDLITRFTPAPDAAPSEPARFALYNVQVRDGEIHFDDRPAARQHEIKAFRLDLPFVSNLAAHVAVKVEPRLAFELNGAAFGTGAQATPFAPTRAGTVNLSVDRFDVTPYLGYAPKVWPVRPQRGVIDSDIQATFSVTPGGASSLMLTGNLRVTDFAANTRDGADLLAWKSLTLGLSDVQPLARKLAFSQVAFDGLTVHARRTADGQFDGLPSTGSTTAKRVPPSAAAAVAMQASAASATALAAPTVPAAWQIGIDSLAVEHGRVEWSDATVSPAASLSLVDVSLKTGRLSLPGPGDMPMFLSATLRSSGQKSRGRGSVVATGAASAGHAALDVAVDTLSLEAFQPYFGRVLTPNVLGQVSGKGRLEWSDHPQAPQLRLALDEASVEDFRLAEAIASPGHRPPTEVASLKRLRVAGVAVDVPARQMTVGEVRLQQPSLSIDRDAQGRWNMQRWLAVGDPPAPAASAASGAAPAAPWKATVQAIVLDGGRLAVADAKGSAHSAPVRTEVTALALDVRHLTWEGDRPAPPADVKLGARLGNGQLAFDGQLGLVPQALSGTLAMTRLPVHALAPFVTLAPGVALARAEAGFKGNLVVRRPANGWEATVKGDVLLADVLLQSREAGEGVGDDLLQWQALALKGLQFDVAAQGRPRINVAEATLNDLRARLVVTEQGRLNLQDAAGGRVGPQSQASMAPADSASAPTSGVASTPSAAVDRASPPGEWPIEATVGQTRITNGRIEFSDNFVRPRYSADLTQLEGRLGTVGTQVGMRMADLELKGRVAGTADLEVSGQVQPLAHPPMLDIKGHASDLELAPLSPYAAKYVGYAIERGKLTMDVAYRIDADGRLDARNQVIVNQLTFGDSVPSREATTLPVRLAVSLLKDRHGVIDINLPISGSLNDPQFSISGLMSKVLGNLIAKAVTSPFSLLAGGAHTDISLLAFEPGTTRLTAEGLRAMEQVAGTLIEKPSLKLTITGTSDANIEREAFQRQILGTRLVAERRKEMLATGGNGEGAADLTASDRSRLLKLLYRQADFPDRPRNALGLLKDLSDADTEAWLKARIPVDDDAMRELALQRAVAVRDAFVAKGLPAERLFLAAPKGKGDDAAWSPRVKLGLTLD